MILYIFIYFSCKMYLPPFCKYRQYQPCICIKTFSNNSLTYLFLFVFTSKKERVFLKHYSPNFFFFFVKKKTPGGGFKFWQKPEIFLIFEGLTGSPKRKFVPWDNWYDGDMVRAPVGLITWKTFASALIHSIRKRVAIKCTPVSIQPFRRHASVSQKSLV